MATLASIVDLVELDMDDTGNTKLSAAEYQSHVLRAVKEFSDAHPIQQETLLSIQKEVHKVSDTTNTIAAAAASDQSSVNTLLNEIKADYNLHRASTTYHKAADSTNVVTSADASDLASSLTLANEIKTDLNAHHILSGVHQQDDRQNTVTTLDAVDLTTVILLSNELKADYTNHLSETTDGRRIYANTVVSDSKFMRVEAVEYPVGLFPQSLPNFDRDGDWLIIKINTDPESTGDIVAVHWHKEHTLNGSASTLPVHYESVIRIGGRAYALQQLVVEKTNTIPIGKVAAYEREANKDLSRFLSSLDTIRKENAASRKPHNIHYNLWQ